MISEIVNLTSIVIALAALWVAVWQTRENSRASAIMNSSPIAADIWPEWRSEEFREHMLTVVNSRPAPGVSTGWMKDLPSDYRTSAYAVIYYFNQVGTLVAFNLVSENLVVGVLGSWIVQTWRALEPVIIRERRHRADTYPPEAPANFSDYFEHLVQRVLDLGGREAMNTIQSQIGVKHLNTPLMNDGAVVKEPGKE
jgi:hypothetical protein